MTIRDLTQQYRLAPDVYIWSNYGDSYILLDDEGALDTEVVSFYEVNGVVEEIEF